MHYLVQNEAFISLKFNKNITRCNQNKTQPFKLIAEKMSELKITHCGNKRKWYHIQEKYWERKHFTMQQRRSWYKNVCYIPDIAGGFSKKTLITSVAQTSSWFPSLISKNLAEKFWLAGSNMAQEHTKDGHQFIYMLQVLIQKLVKLLFFKYVMTFLNTTL